jgi:WD40 repeat protein
MDICVRKPLIVTCGADKFIRVWNYEEKTIEAYKSYTEEAYCVSFHPSGFHIVVGFSDKYNLTLKHFAD